MLYPIVKANGCLRLLEPGTICTATAGNPTRGQHQQEPNQGAPALGLFRLTYLQSGVAARSGMLV